MLKKILVPLDGSQLAEQALPYAKSLAQKYEAELILLMVIPPFSLPVLADPYGGVLYKYPTEAEINKHQEAAQTYLSDLQKSLRQQNIMTRIQVLEDASTAEGIVNVASREKVDVIVKTTHGRSGLSRWVYGSVATKVLQEAPCPIFLVRVK
jgi:nucleotide-binding universal stress UspA family protein